MTQDDFNAFCATLPASTHVVQWGGSDVWKVGGKVYAIGGMSKGPDFAVTFKVSQMMFEVLRDEAGFRPAPYLASRGMSWIQSHEASDLRDRDLAHLIGQSHAMIAAALSRKVRKELGLEGTAP